MRSSNGAEEIQPLAPDLSLGRIFLKNHQDRLQVIAEVKASPSREISISDVILCNRPRLMKQMAQ